MPEEAYAVAPVLARELAGDRLDLGARRRVGGGERRRGQVAVGEIPLRQSHATDLERLESFRREPAPDDELGRAAADVDHEARLGRGGQHVGDAGVDEPRFLVAGDDVDREAERALRLRQERPCVGRDAERVRRHRPHRRGMQALDPLAEAREAGERGAPRLRCQAALRIDTGADAQRLAPGVETVDLVALDAPDLEAEAVRAHVDDGERFGGGRTRHGDRA